jgi:hypothetical protein
VGTAFARSTDFAIDKPAGVPCPHLAPGPDDFGCTIHDRLPESGFPGCAAFDCFGAGQRVVQHTYAGTTWRDAPESAAEMFAVFTVVRALHELLWYLGEAIRLPAAAPLAARLREAEQHLERLALSPAATLARVDVEDHRAALVPLLRQASELARAGIAGPDLAGPELAGADLSGGRLAGRDLRGANLRGALLLGADLRGADLRLVDLTGADLRGCDVRGTDLREVLFLTRLQVGAARGDRSTLLPTGLQPPAHWPAGSPRGPGPDPIPLAHGKPRP